MSDGVENIESPDGAIEAAIVERQSADGFDPDLLRQAEEHARLFPVHVTYTKSDEGYRPYCCQAGTNLGFGDTEAEARENCWNSLVVVLYHLLSEGHPLPPAETWRHEVIEIDGVEHPVSITIDAVGRVTVAHGTERGLSIWGRTEAEALAAYRAVAPTFLELVTRDAESGE